MVSTSDELALANKIIFLKNNLDAVDDIKNNAYNTALNYTIDNIIEKMKEIYEV